MRAKVVLLARTGPVKSSTGKDLYPFVPVDFKRGRPVPVDGATVYYLRYSEGGRRKVEPVGVNLDEAYIQYLNREQNLSRVRAGLLPLQRSEERDNATPSAQNRVRVIDAANKYISDLIDAVATGEKSKATLRGYAKTVERFRDHCGVEFMDEITTEVLMQHKKFLFQNIKGRARGKRINTIAKCFRFLSTFLTKNGIQMTKAKNARYGDRGLMDRSEVPREEKKACIDKYSEEEIKAMLSVANIDEGDLIQTFVRTGFRDEEVVYLHWSDIDFRKQQITISEKPDFGWRPKDKEARTIPLEDGVLLRRLAARQKRQKLLIEAKELPETKLVFPNTNGDPDQHLINKLHKIVSKARANGSEFEGDITLHRFRRTYASMMISHSDLQTVSKLLGHSNIETTARYLAPDQSKARIGTRTAFAGIGD